MQKQDKAQLEAQLAALRAEYAEVERSLPRHSVKASHIMRLEALEDSIAEIEAVLGSQAERDDSA